VGGSKSLYALNIDSVSQILPCRSTEQVGEPKLTGPEKFAPELSVVLVLFVVVVVFPQLLVVSRAVVLLSVVVVVFPQLLVVSRAVVLFVVVVVFS